MDGHEWGDMKDERGAARVYYADLFKEKNDDTRADNRHAS